MSRWRQADKLRHPHVHQSKRAASDLDDRPLLLESTIIMQRTIRRTLPIRMVALSLLPPPNSFAPKAPFGFGAFVIDPKCRGEASFALHMHGYGAGHDPAPMCDAIRTLFDPETMALICAISRFPAGELVEAPFPDAYLDLVPRTGLRRNLFAPLPRHILASAGRVGGLDLPDTEPTPLARLGQIGGEAQAAWIFWLQTYCPVNLRRKLLASYLAWQQLQRARALPVHT